ncbi:hypothetical protein [Kitasatospora sp. NPDC057223]|uniref:hypothetical protein n=1 Tax=Kitasatospora sp. NPDC057223 TaxID=3346055 RepID=UPI00362A0053
MAQRTWPTREEWAAKAEYSVRTACLPNERVSNKPADWLTADELDEARTLIPAIVKAARAGLNRAVKAVRLELGAIPTGVGYYDWHENLTTDQKHLADQYHQLLSARRHLNSESKRAFDEYATADDLLFAWGRIGVAAKRAGIANGETDRLNVLQHTLAERRSAAAEQALKDAIELTVDRRNSDEGWAAELERRADIDAGPRVTYHRT